ncbi:MAG: transposase [Octadecabacter sp.]
MKERRKNWFRHHLPAMQAHPDRLVFIDETSVKTNLTRQYGRSLCGTRLEMDAPFGAWGTQTFIAGLKHDSLVAPWVIKGAMDGEAFEIYVRNVLAPELQPGTVVICDNLATHYNKGSDGGERTILPPTGADPFFSNFTVVHWFVKKAT